MEDKYIKYKLPFNKNEIDLDSHYMTYGGKQLLELFEKEFNYENVIENPIKYKIKGSQIDRLRSWMKHKCDTNKMDFRGPLKTSFFYKGAGVLAILLEQIDITPVLVDNKFESRFSFIDLNVIENEKGIIVQTVPNKENWYERSTIVSGFGQLLVENLFYYVKDENDLVRVDLDKSDVAKDLKTMFDVSNELVK